MGVFGQRHAPGRFTPRKETRYPLYRRLGEPQGRSWRVQKISPLPGFDPRTVQPVASMYQSLGKLSVFLSLENKLWRCSKQLPHLVIVVSRVTSTSACISLCLCVCSLLCMQGNVIRRLNTHTHTHTYLRLAHAWKQLKLSLPVCERTQREWRYTSTLSSPQR